MALLFVLMSLGLIIRGLSYLFGLNTTAAFTPDPLFLLTLFLTLFAAVAGNIGFMGLALDQARATAREQRAALQALRDNQMALDGAARTREAVASERARTTRLLAHEVRQPLHNAAVALQSAVGTLSRSREPAEAARAIEQAQSVIRRVSATLDNTVAATALLTSEGRISTADADLQVLIDLCLGDLPPEARPRVQVDYRADARSVRLEPTLARLAVRNLLANATLYTPADSPVILRVLDSDDPLALVIEVIDEGPGIPDALRERIFDEGVRGQQATVPGYGLGLHVVKRVAKLHGGRIEWAPNQPKGSIFRLTLPQGDPA
jgi:signal transduction histidine kinase